MQKPAVASAPPSAPARTASATIAAMAESRRLPNMSGPARISACGPAASPSQARSGADTIMSLPGKRGASGLEASVLAASTLEASTLGASASAAASTLGASILGASAPAPAPCPGTRSGAAAIGWLCASDEGEVAGLASPQPDSALVCSACCSLTENSPGKVDHLVLSLLAKSLPAAGLRKF